MDGDALPAVPSPTGRKVLAFVFVVLLEYFLAPMFFGVTNYAGIWEAIGTVLFFALAVSLLLFVVAPLVPHLQVAFQRGARRRFHAVWIAVFGAGLFFTNILQFSEGPTSGPVLFGEVTAYTPLGAWPTLTIYVPGPGIWASLNLEEPFLLFLLSFLTAAAVSVSAASSCALAAPRSTQGTWRSRALASLSVGPLGLVSACPTCLPAYLAVLSSFAPSLAWQSWAAIPLVPWIGLAGLLYLLGFWMAIRAIHRVLSPASLAAPVPRVVAAGAAG